jgi:hypothetical protein
MTEGARRASPNTALTPFRIGAIVVIAIAIAVIVWLIVKGDDNKSSNSGPKSNVSAATPATLKALPGQVGHEVYWAGRRPNVTYEVTEVTGNIYLRYLPAGVGLGDPRPSFLVIGSYPKPNATRVLKQLARQKGNNSQSISRGGLAVWSNSRPQSVYVAYPGSDVQVEVYDPSAPRAKRLATSGAVKPIR